MTSEDCSGIHAFERYQKHSNFCLLLNLTSTCHCPRCLLCDTESALLVQHKGVENACLDYAMSLDLHKQTIVAGLRKGIGK
jgi:hypothetical protein